MVSSGLKEDSVKKGGPTVRLALDPAGRDDDGLELNPGNKERKKKKVDQGESDRA